MVFWELSSRTLPYEGASAAVSQTCIQGAQREDMPEDTPTSFAKLISRCWAQRAEDRLKASGVVEALLSDTLAELQTGAGPSSGYQYFSQ